MTQGSLQDQLRKANAVATEALATARSGSTEEMAAVLLGRAARAAENGNYGIAAAVILPFDADSAELVIFGENTLFSNHDPLGHAETSALRRLSAFLNEHPRPRPDAWDPLKVLDAAHYRWCRSLEAGQIPRATLLTTLEPCPMCTVAILNAGITEVGVWRPDEMAGTMLDERHARLGPVWADMASSRALRVTDASQDIPARLTNTLDGLFAANRAVLDARITAHGVVDLEELQRTESR